MNGLHRTDRARRAHGIADRDAASIRVTRAGHDVLNVRRLDVARRSAACDTWIASSARGASLRLPPHTPTPARTAETT